MLFPNSNQTLYVFHVLAPSWSIEGCGYEQLQWNQNVALQVIFFKDVHAVVQTLQLDLCVLPDPLLKAETLDAH